MEFVTVKEMAARWGLSERRLQTMCNEGMIEGVKKFGTAWAIPDDAEKPIDKRVVSGQYINWRKKEEKITNLETELADCDAQLSDPSNGNNVALLQDLSKKRNELESSLEKLYEEWEELAE